VTAPSQGARGERKFAVALFADLSGYTALCQRLDPEDVELTVAPLMRALRTTVETEAGVIANVAGDGFFAIFGVPTALADAASRAARAAHMVRDLVASRNAQPGLPAVPDVHVGIASGELLVTPSDDAPGWSVIGRAVNLASRLCDAAGPGEVLFDEATHRLVSHETSWAEQRSIQVRGHDSEVVAWPLVGLEPGRTTQQLTIPFVNRVDVLDRLDAEWRRVLDDGTSSVVSVHGEPGIGKSRVVSHWLAQQADAHSLWLWCGAVTGQPVLRLLDLLVGMTGEPTPDARALLEAPRSVDVSATYRTNPFPLVLAVSRRLLERAAASPLVLVVDDAHAADPSLVEVIADLRARPVPARLLIVCTQRTGESSHDLAADIHVGPLGPDETDDVISAALGARPPDAVRTAILTRVDGHPLMALQSAAYLLEAGVVAVTDDRCDVVTPGAVDVLPTSLRLFVTARLDRLPAAEKAVIQELSTFGDDFADDWIQEVLGTGSRDLVPAVAGRGLLATSETGGWRFAHGLVQEVAYASLTRRSRSQLHKRQLGLLGEDARADLRAYHAIAWAEAAPAADVDDHRAAGIAGLDATLHLARQLHATQARSAHEAIRRARGVLEDAAGYAPELAVQILTLDAQCLIELGQFEQALQTTTVADEHAARAAIEAATRVRLMLARGYALSRLRRYQSARQALDEAAALAEANDDRTGWAQSLRLMADTWRHSVFSRFISLTESAYDGFIEAGDEAGAGDCARMLAYLFSPASPALYDKWSGIARDSTDEADVRGQAALARSESFAHEARMDFAAALAKAQVASELGERAGSTDIVVDGLATQIQCLIALGDPQRATATAERLIEIADAHANPRVRITAGALAAPAFLRCGQPRRAAEEVERSLAGVAGFGPSERHEVSQAEGLVSRDRGEWESAFRAFADSLAGAEETGFALFQVRERVEQVRVQLALASLRHDDLAGLRADADQLASPLVSSYVASVDDLARVLAREGPAQTEPHADAGLEELAIRAETAALDVELRGAVASQLWADASAAWQALGYTIWLARAQARSGDVAAAHHTLEVLDAKPGARDWALGQPRRGGSSSS
jgi:class 3 adenylate cyclase/tetratricopeptide (TPR) repeat protein